MNAFFGNWRAIAIGLWLAGCLTPCRAQLILEDDYNVTNSGSGFALGSGVNSGINPPTTRLNGAAAKNLRYIKAYGSKADSLHYITSNAAISFLAAHTNQPCYVDLWFNDVHTGWFPAPGTWEKYAAVTTNVNEQKFYAVLANVDVQVGRFLAALDTLGLSSNTIVIYSSDNGAPGDSGSAPFVLARNDGLRGVKGSLYEGGIREPFMVRWPGHIPAGVTNTGTVLCGVDLVPTLCNLAQIQLPVSYLPDGQDMSAAFLGQAQTRTNALYWWFINDFGPAAGSYNHAPPLALRSGDWKVLTDYTKSTVELYNEITDPFERNNVAVSQSAMANSLADQLVSWWQTLPK